MYVTEPTKKPQLVNDKPRPRPRDAIPGRNGGWLRNGGTNKGGPGRPKDELRQALREGIPGVLEQIESRIQSDPTVTMADLVRYADFRARYGLGTQQETDMTVNDAVFTPEERAARVLELVKRADQRAKRA